MATTTCDKKCLKLAALPRNRAHSLSIPKTSMPLVWIRQRKYRQCLGPLYVCTFNYLTLILSVCLYHALNSFTHFVLFPLPLLPYLATWPTSTHTSLSLAIKICHIFGLTLASQSLPSPILALLKGYNGASCSKHIQFKNFLKFKFLINSLSLSFLVDFFGSRKLSPHYCHTFGL